MANKILLLILLSTLVACSSSQYKETSHYCTKNSYKKFPVKEEAYVKRVKQFGSRKVKTGTTCNSNVFYGTVTTNCRPTYKTETYTYYVNENAKRDKNKDLRDKWKKKCISSTCLKEYGNSECVFKSTKAQNEKKKLLDVTKEELEESGLTLREYANYMIKNHGKRPPPKKTWKDKACEATELC